MMVANAELDGNDTQAQVHLIQFDERIIQRNESHGVWALIRILEDDLRNQNDYYSFI